MFRNWRLWFDHKHSAHECVTRNQKEPAHWSQRGHLKQRLGLMMTNDLALFLSSTACGAVPVGNWFTWNIRTTLEIRDWLNNQGLFIRDDRRHITFDRHSCSPMARWRSPVGVTRRYCPSRICGKRYNLNTSQHHIFQAKNNLLRWASQLVSGS